MVHHPQIAESGGLSALGDRTEIELIDELAYPFPATVVGDLCGVPRDKTKKLKFWADEISKFVLQGRDTQDRYGRSFRAL